MTTPTQPQIERLTERLNAAIDHEVELAQDNRRLTEALMTQTTRRMTMEAQTNGSESPGELAVRHGIASYQTIVTERDELAKKLETAEKLIAVYKIEIEGYRAQAAAESNRTVSYQHERDESVSKYAALERTVDDIYAIILRSKATEPGVDWSEAHPEIAEKIRDLK